MLGFLLNLINPIAEITKGIIAWQEKRTNAQTEQARIEADENIKALEARRDVLIAESRTPWNAAFRIWLALPPSLYIAKLIVWDKMLGWGQTDDLSNNLWWIVFIVYGFYFAADMKRIFGK